MAVADQFDILLRVHHYRADKALKQLQERSEGPWLRGGGFYCGHGGDGDFEALLHNESLGPLMAQAMKELPEVNCTHPNPIQASVISSRKLSTPSMLIRPVIPRGLPDTGSFGPGVGAY